MLFPEKTLQESLDTAGTINFYGKDFLIERPVLKGDKREEALRPIVGRGGKSLRGDRVHPA